MTISSITCAGSTTLATSLAAFFGWQVVNPVSQAFRAYLSDHHLPMSAGDQVPDSLHTSLDRQVKEKMKSESYVIFLGRTTGWLAHDFDDIFKVFLTAQLPARAIRYATREHMITEQASHEVAMRDANDWQRYKKLYDIDYTDPNWYDLIIDTTNIPPEVTLQRVIDAITARKKR